MNRVSSAFALGPGVLILYLAFLSAFVPLSLDLYLPALPSMSEYFKAAPELTNLTLSLFTLFFAISMIIWGPLSDKYGRKPILLIGSLLYIASSVALALCESVYQLILFRCLQAIGSGAISAVSMAIVKDVYKGRTMESVLTWIQTITVLAPMLAPVVGGVMLRLTSWRGIFWVLTGCGVVALSGLFFLRETMRNPTQGSALASLGRIGYVLGQKDFRRLLLCFSVIVMAFMSYVGCSSYIYNTEFKVTPQEFSYFFAANAAVSMLGPVLYARILRELPRRGYLAGCFLLTACCGLLIIFFGAKGPFVFAALFAPIAFIGGAARPATTMLLMNQINTDNGTVASLIGSTALLLGSLSLLLCSLPWPSFIMAAGVIPLCSGLVAAVSWLLLDRKRRFTAGKKS